MCFALLTACSSSSSCSESYSIDYEKFYDNHFDFRMLAGKHYSVQSEFGKDTISFIEIEEDHGTIELTTQNSIANDGCSDGDLIYDYRSVIAKSFDGTHHIHMQLVGEELGNKVYLFIDDYIYSLSERITLKEQFTSNKVNSQYDWLGQITREYSDSNSIQVDYSKIKGIEHIVFKPNQADSVVWRLL